MVAPARASVLVSESEDEAGQFSEAENTSVAHASDASGDEESENEAIASQDDEEALGDSEAEEEMEAELAAGESEEEESSEADDEAGESEEDGESEEESSEADDEAGESEEESESEDEDELDRIDEEKRRRILHDRATQMRASVYSTLDSDDELNAIIDRELGVSEAALGGSDGISDDAISIVGEDEECPDRSEDRAVLRAAGLIESAESSSSEDEGEAESSSDSSGDDSDPGDPYQAEHQAEFGSGAEFESDPDEDMHRPDEESSGDSEAEQDSAEEEPSEDESESESPASSDAGSDASVAETPLSVGGHLSSVFSAPLGRGSKRTADKTSTRESKLQCVSGLGARK